MTTPREVDRRVAEEIYRKPQGLVRASMAAQGLSPDGLVEIIARHMAPERERAEQLEIAVKNALPYLPKWLRERAEAALRKETGK